MRRRIDRSAPRPRSFAAARAGVTSVLAAATLLLSGCGMIAAFVPPIEVGDPLGVDDRTVTAALNAGPIAPQATSHVDAVVTADIPDLEQDLHGFSLAGFRADVGLADVVHLVGASDPSLYPDTITVTGALVAARLSDAHAAVEFEERFDLEVEFHKESCDAVSCSYRLAEGASAAGILAFGLTDRAQLATLVDILIRDGEETANTGRVRVALQLESTPDVAGLTATFRLRSEGSTIELGG